MVLYGAERKIPNPSTWGTLQDYQSEALARGLFIRGQHTHCSHFFYASWEGRAIRTLWS